MAGSSPAGRRWTHSRSSPVRSPPARSPDSTYLSGDRNGEMNHLEALMAAQVLHDDVRERAVTALQNHLQELEQKKRETREQEIRERQRREEDRLRHEEKLRHEEERLRALQAQTVPKLPPKPPQQPAPPPEPAPQTNTVAPSKEDTTPATQPAVAKSTTTPNPFSPGSVANGSSASALPTEPAKVNGHASSAAPSSAAASPFTKPATSQPANPFATVTSTATKPASQAPTQAQPAKPPAVPDVDRYVQIHRNLKKLRAQITEHAKTNPELKKLMGEMRREIRKSLGQLTGVKGANKKQLETIRTILTSALNGQPPSPMIDPSSFVVDDRREPVEGAIHNEPQLPALFLYLLNQLGKAIINQFINECGASPKSADPVGVVTAQLFSAKEFLWRGQSLIDILMAKFRVVCPVVFGYRGSDKTEQGRIRLGWRKDGGTWISEQQHNDRMMGLGIGYASIALRDFSKSSNINPWPPSRYWKSMANIVNTPPAEMTDTQCIVLKSMLNQHEEKFINFYGSAAVAALRRALVEWPNSAPKKTPGVMGLQVLAVMYKKDMGLDLGL
ncbi:GLE1-like protein-domain-containing protein [Apiospora arundinis]|uniref:mRNA export factor GLE1 n=1 Tax=Apiospora arundinis TaxID=335852 RepID=A0ABR2I351_9PEZI